ncbi:MAG: murein hydrolase activator EnvC family protein [Endomicrobiia bacterium]
MIFCQLIFSQQDIKKTQKEIEKTKKNIQQKTKQKQQYDKTTKELQNQLKNIEIEIKKIENQKKQIENKIEKVKITLSSIKKNIELIESDIEFYSRVLNISLNNFVKQYIIKKPFIENNFIRRMKKNVIKKYSEQIVKSKVQKNYVLRLKREYEIKQNELINYHKQLEEKKQAQKKLFIEKNQLLKQISTKKKQIEKEIKDLISTQNALEKLLRKLKEEQKRKEIVLHSQQKKTIPKINRTFIKPISGEIVCKFGKEQIESDGSCIIRNGVIIQGISFDKIVSIEDGKVIFISQNFRSYGKLVIIEHKDEIHSVYGQVGKIIVYEGEEVKKGQTIAETDSSGQIYFELRKSFIPVNPEMYLE